MGGLVGWVDFSSDLEKRREILDRMTGTMRDRGPDAGGTWISRSAGLGNRALFTGKARGSGGPARVETPAGEGVAVLTGELHDPSEPGAEDPAEALVHAYLRWGPAFVERTSGAFGFALWDGRERKLILGRDRMGVKPLYYHAYRDGILFASEPKGIMAHPRFKARLDLSKLPVVLQPRLAMPGETPLAGLHEVPPAHLVVLTEEGLSTRRYWRLESAPHEDSFDKTARRVRELLEDAVARQVAPGAPMGAMLSGGVDSTSVAALSARLLAPDARLRTFCLRFAGDTEHFTASELRPDIDAPFAEAAAAELGTDHTTLTASVADLLATVPATRSARDLPGWGQFDASMRLLFQHMSSTCRVVMTGEAADEVFGGYPYFFRRDVLDKDGFPWMFGGPKLVDHLAPDLAAELDPAADERARYETLLERVPRLPGEDPDEARIRELFFFGLSGPLSVILDRKERMSASLGLDVRVPFCDHRLVEYVWNVPWSMKSAGGVKGLLKAAMADVLPAAVVNRKKSAYPHVQNPDYDRTLLAEAAWIVNDPGSPLRHLFDTARMNALIQRISTGRMKDELPGGSNPAALLIQLVEMRHWVEDYQVEIPS